MLTNLVPGQRTKEGLSQGIISCTFPPPAWINLANTETFTIVYEATVVLVGLTGRIHSLRIGTQEYGEIA